jgi:dUTP pyrophosphatase
MQVKIKKTHSNAVIPKYSKPGDAGLDLTAVSVSCDSRGVLTYDTGIAVEIPEGYVGLVFPRSSIADYELILTNSVGVIDSGYRSSIKAKFTISQDYWSEASDNEDFQNELEFGNFLFYETAEYESRDIAVQAKVYAVGDRIAQLIIIPYPQIEFEEVKELSITERNTGGFGSSGK